MKRPDFLALASVLDGLQQAKGIAYGNSWEKRGEMGILHQIFRKMDRIENLVYTHEKTGLWASGGESLPETVADLAVYALLWMSRFYETDPDNFQSWLHSVKNFVEASPIEDKVKENVNNAYLFILQKYGRVPEGS